MQSIRREQSHKYFNEKTYKTFDINTTFVNC